MADIVRRITPELSHLDPLQKPRRPHMRFSTSSPRWKTSTFALVAIAAMGASSLVISGSASAQRDDGVKLQDGRALVAGGSQVPVTPGDPVQLATLQSGPLPAWLDARRGLVENRSKASSVCVPLPEENRVKCPDEHTDAVCYRVDLGYRIDKYFVPSCWSGELAGFFAIGGPPTSVGEPGGALFLSPVLVAEGIALGTTGYSDWGWTVTSDARDMEALRQDFGKNIYSPKWSFIYGASYGGAVAARVAELYPDNYVGLFTACGVTAGTWWRLIDGFDMRVMYQYFCHNHPSPDEPQYPLNQGLPPGVIMPLAEVQARYEACLGRADSRTAEQQAIVNQLLNLTRIPEESAGNLNYLVALLNAGTTWPQKAFADFGGAISGNRWFVDDGYVDLTYDGCTNPEICGDINQRVERDFAITESVHAVRDDGEPSGQAFVPVVGVHAIFDYQVHEENDGTFAERIRRLGGQVYQVFTNDRGHCGVTSSEWLAGIDVLLDQALLGIVPTDDTYHQYCLRYQNSTPSLGRCSEEFGHAPGQIEDVVRERGY